MIVYLLALAVVSLCFVECSHFHMDYLSKDSTNAIKGIFTIIILFSHMKGYLQLTDQLYDTAYLRILNFIGQMMVAPFLFYSGYGIMESFKTKRSYYKYFPTRRLLKTLLHFDIAVVLFILIQTSIGKTYPLYKYFTCWFAWDSIGNSNWFVFDILALYVVAYFGMLISVRAFKACDNEKYSLLLLFVLAGCCVLFVLLLFLKHGQAWWVNTIYTFPLGIAYSLYKSQIDEFLYKPKLYWCVFVFLSGIFILWYHKFAVDLIGISSILFTLLIIMVTMKVKFSNKALNWLGNNAFAIYILQRLPMNVLSWYGVNNNIAFFSVISVVLVLFIAAFFTRILGIIDAYCFSINTIKTIKD